MIVVRLGWGLLASTPDRRLMAFETVGDALHWATSEGLFEGATLDCAKAHGVQGDRLDGWVDSRGLYKGAVIEVHGDAGPDAEERDFVEYSARVLFPGEC